MHDRNPMLLREALHKLCEPQLQIEQSLVHTGMVSAAKGENITSVIFQLNDCWDCQTMEGQGCNKEAH